MTLRRFLVVAPALCLPLAAPTCEQDPVATEAQTYHDEMVPLLVRNADLARDFRDLAADIKRDKTSAKDVARLMDTEVIPAAQALARDAAAVRPATLSFQQPHERLVSAWTDRLTAYQDIKAAWKTRDLDAYDRAAAANLEAHKRESHYYDEINVLLAPHQLSLEPYPASAPSP